ncbi:MAG TPA: Asp-tRNA(Asn)/Glu-tRNA(Gln) amidotransferase subunit GatC [Candidatus Saccharimonadales bacterium]|nr:Asp-tRNA(Asn)/Glu-tRNA(Gln) amidotransferase subunit GatC [Candidatus Saccharimonadales bacterium]
MKSLSFDDVKKLADLSQLELSESEANALQTDLAKIIDYVNQLQAVDTEGVEPTYQVNYSGTVTRDDQPVDYGVTPQAMLQLAPDTQDGQIKVPRVIQ